jgi:hypothetical protein
MELNLLEREKEVGMKKRQVGQARRTRMDGTPKAMDGLDGGSLQFFTAPARHLSFWTNTPTVNCQRLVLALMMHNSSSFFSILFSLLHSDTVLLYDSPSPSPSPSITLML